MNNKNRWDKHRGLSKEELKAMCEDKKARDAFIEEKTLAMLEQCKGLTISEIKKVTESVLSRASAMAFLSR